MLPLDFHAHVDPSINPGALRALNACVVAVTRSLGEFSRVIGRTDEFTAWAVGAHPAAVAGQIEFSIDRFRESISQVPIVGEVGLDGNRSTVNLSLQSKTLEGIFRVIANNPRILTVHSDGATAPLLEMLEEFKLPGIVLHWWKGTSAETERALNLDCWFSINSFEASRPKLLQELPRERIFAETDHPFGDRRQIGVKQPGQVGIVESALAKQWNVDVGAVRWQIWRNLLEVAESTGTPMLFPRAFKRSMLAV